MSIEQKISELLEESRKLKGQIQEETEEQIEDSFDESLEENVVTKDAVAAEPMQKVDAEEDDQEDNNDNKKAAAATNKEVSTKESSAVEKKNAVAAEPMKAVKEEISVDVSEDVAALVNGEELSEEFKTKATIIFEAAVLNRVKQEVAKLEESYEEKLAAAQLEIQEGLVEQVDGYLGLMVEQWMEKNALALESGMKSEILEGFIGGLKSLFEEHYIDIPEEKFDVLGDMETQIEDLQAKLNESVDHNLSIKKELDAIKKLQSIAEASEGMTDTETEKFKGLAEELSYEDVDTFKTKLQTIRENYFTNKAKTEVNSVVTDEPVVEQKVLSETMSRYTQALGANTTFR